MNAGLKEGATDGKYRKVRPDTEVGSDVKGNEDTLNNRQSLNPFFGYGFVTSEFPNDQKVNPGK
jgi:hypothetical protein